MIFVTFFVGFFGITIIVIIIIYLCSDTKELQPSGEKKSNHAAWRLICTLSSWLNPLRETKQSCQEGCPQMTTIKVTAGWTVSHLACGAPRREGRRAGGFPTVLKNERGQEEVRRYLLGAFGGLLREVVVGVVSLRDATEQHRHHTCRGDTNTQASARWHNTHTERHSFRV